MAHRKMYREDVRPTLPSLRDLFPGEPLPCLGTVDLTFFMQMNFLVQLDPLPTQLLRGSFLAPKTMTDHLFELSVVKTIN